MPSPRSFHVSSNRRVSVRGMSDPGERRSSRGHGLTGDHHQDREQQGNVWLGGEGVFRKRSEEQGERETLCVEREVSSTCGIIWNMTFSDLPPKMQSRTDYDKKQTNAATKGKPNETEQRYTRPVQAGETHDPDSHPGGPGAPSGK